jgi:hypothetical protein
VKIEINTTEPIWQLQAKKNLTGFENLSGLNSKLKNSSESGFTGLKD